MSRPHPLPSEPDRHLSTHPAQASNNASDENAVAPLALGSTWTLLRQSRLPKIGGGRTSKDRCDPADRSALPPDAGWLSVHVRRHPREVCPLSRGVMCSTPIRPITGRPSLPPSSFTRRPVGSPCGWPSLAGGRRAYHVASQESSWVRPRLYAGGTSSAPEEFGASGPGHVPFGPSLSAPLACLCLRRLRRFTWVDHTTRPWSPTAVVLAVAISARALIATLAGEDTLSRGLRTPPLPATHASVGDCWQNSRCCHLLLEEQHTSRDTLVSHADGQKTTTFTPHRCSVSGRNSRVWSKNMRAA